MPIPAGPLVTSTSLDLIERTRWHLNTGQTEQQNRLTGSLDTAATSLTFDFDLSGIRAGAVIHLGLESMYVWEVVSTTSHIVTVQRGFGGTTAATHAAGDLVEVNPRFSNFTILQALNDELRSLTGLGLYQVGIASFTFDGTARTYDLSSDLIEVLEVRYDSSGTTNRWPVITDFEVLRDMDTTKFASGIAIRLDGRVESQRTVRVRYRKPYGLLSSLSDDAATVTGMHPEALDIPPLGAAAMIAQSREVRRTDTFAQGDTRRSNEVPAGMPQASARGLLQRRSLRVGEEQARLYQRYPLRRPR